MVWAATRSLAATEVIDFSFFSTSYLDVSVHWVCHVRLCIQRTLIQESRDHHLFVNSPELFADFHAFLRHLMPRHPPCALNSLTTSIQPSHIHNVNAKRRRMRAISQKQTVYREIISKQPATQRLIQYQYIYTHQQRYPLMKC